MKKLLAVFAYCLLQTANCFGQLPDCDIWLLDIKGTAGNVTFQNPVNITNRQGYDNQPAFSPDNKYILYSSQKDSSGQTDIFKYAIKAKVTTQFTKTATSEYSPTFMPDGKNISVVMVEPDSVQRLWKFPIKAGVPALIMKDVDSIGYHYWISKDSVALFILTDPPTLQVTSINLQQPTVVAKNVGRCVQRTPSYGGRPPEKVWTFVEKLTDNHWKLNSLHYSKKSKLKTTAWCSICNMPDKVEDFALSQLGIFAAQGSKIYNLKEDIESVWSEVFDLSEFGITDITRIAISTDGKKLAVVSNK